MKGLDYIQKFFAEVLDLLILNNNSLSLTKFPQNLQSEVFLTPPLQITHSKHCQLIKTSKIFERVRQIVVV